MIEVGVTFALDLDSAVAKLVSQVICWDEATSPAAAPGERLPPAASYRLTAAATAGLDGAASWDSTDNIGVGAQFVLRNVRPGDGDGRYLVDLTVTSRRFNGEGTFDIGVRDDLITRLVIS